MLVALPATPRGKNGTIRQEMTRCLTTFALLLVSMFLLNLPGVDRFAALSHSAGLAVRSC
jgi:hypothetical protein